MRLLDRIKPKFWRDHADATGPYKHLVNFRRLWKKSILLMVVVTLAPLILMALVDYNVNKQAINSDILLRTARLVSNTRRTVGFFLEERRAALEFIVRNNLMEELISQERLKALLSNLKFAFGGFTDLGVIDESGTQRAYSGPYDLQNAYYGGQEWYKEVIEHGVYISDVFLGFRQTPHFVIAFRYSSPSSAPYVVRAAIDIKRFTTLLSKLDISGKGDAFIINREGILQTPSRFYGDPLERIPLPVPEYSDRSRVLDTIGPDGKPLLVGYAYIQGTPFVLMICKQKTELIKPWRKVRFILLGFLAVSIAGILVVILGVSTYLVGEIYEADQKRVAALHQAEYSNKMASIGRLAAGVAHEINNPLAIIGEKAGLIKDIFNLQQSYAKDDKLLKLVDAILHSVDRCANITHRLLSFARHMEAEPSLEKLNIGEVIEEVLEFLHKEAIYRSITVKLFIPKDIPAVETDRGKLQQILLNLINNAFAAMSDGGRLEISVSHGGDRFILLSLADDGCGIPESDIKRIFEPFFSTKAVSGGTGLGLSITYGLVKELGGEIDVRSELGKGTTFSVTLPIEQRHFNEENNTSVARG